MLGLAISVGASGTLLSKTEGAVAADVPNASFLMAAALPPAGDTAPRAAVYHTVREGESLWQIAQAHQVDVQTIKAANGISPAEVLKVGQVIRVPADGASTSVRESKLPAAPSVAPTPEPAALATKVSSETEAVVTEVSQLPTEGTALASGEPAVESAVEPAAQSAMSEAAALASVSPTEAAPKAAVELQAAASTPQSGLAPAGLNEGASSEAAPSSEGTWITRSFEAPASSSANSSPEAETIALEPVASESADVPENSRETQLGVKVPQQIAAISERIEGATVTQPQVPTVPSTATYQVKPGDTLWTIASRYGLNPETLAAANQVTNPNLIVAGEVIAIPQGEQAVERSSDLAAAPSVPVGEPASARIARLREANSGTLDRAALYERIRQARQSLATRQTETTEVKEVAADSASSELASDMPLSLPLNDASSGRSTASAADPHAANLIADIRAMQRQQTVAIAPAESITAEEPAAQLAVAPRPQPQVGGEGPVNPEFSPAAPESAAPNRELLAAAPLSPEAYAPTMDAPTGRVVSPNMPILPGPDQYLPDAPDRFSGYMWPAQGVLTSGYGPRWGRMHRGVDIAGPVGTPIYAAASGTVVRAGWNSGGYGNLVDIRHADGSMTRYGHNSRLLVRAGQEVRQGQQIAEMGSTGYSTGPHLHFEVHLPGSGTVNPMAYLPSR
ncbi:MAG TPA: peptidoglycan DD-metalloendopeptidase family protein [Trichocoleus sp.]